MHASRIPSALLAFLEKNEMYLSSGFLTDYLKSCVTVRSRHRFICTTKKGSE